MNTIIKNANIKTLRYTLISHGSYKMEGLKVHILRTCFQPISQSLQFSYFSSVQYKITICTKGVNLAKFYWCKWVFLNSPVHEICPYNSHTYYTIYGF